MTFEEPESVIAVLQMSLYSALNKITTNKLSGLFQTAKSYSSSLLERPWPFTLDTLEFLIFVY